MGVPPHRILFPIPFPPTYPPTPQNFTQGNRRQFFTPMGGENHDSPPPIGTPLFGSSCLEIPANCRVSDARNPIRNSRSQFEP